MSLYEADSCPHWLQRSLRRGCEPCRRENTVETCSMTRGSAVLVQAGAPLSHVSCYLFSWRSQGVLLGFPGWSWLCWHLEARSVMAFRVVVYRSSHNYCPSLLCSSLSRALLLLRCLSRCRLWLSHLSLAATHRVPSLSHLPPFSHTYRHSVTRSLSHTLIPFPAPCDIRSLSSSLCPGGLAMPGRPAWGAPLPRLLHIGRQRHNPAVSPLHSGRGTGGVSRGQMPQEDL